MTLSFVFVLSVLMSFSASAGVLLGRGIYHDIENKNYVLEIHKVYLDSNQNQIGFLARGNFSWERFKFEKWGEQGFMWPSGMANYPNGYILTTGPDTFDYHQQNWKEGLKLKFKRADPALSFECGTAAHPTDKYVKLQQAADFDEVTGAAKYRFEWGDETSGFGTAMRVGELLVFAEVDGGGGWLSVNVRDPASAKGAWSRERHETPLICTSYVQ